MEELEQLSEDVQKEATKRLPVLKHLERYIELDRTEKAIKSEKQGLKPKAIEENLILRRTGIKEYMGCKISYTTPKPIQVLDSDEELQKLEEHLKAAEAKVKDLKAQGKAKTAEMLEEGRFTTDPKKKTNPSISLSHLTQ